MCQYITLTLPKDTDLESIKPVFEKFGLTQKVIHNQFVEEQIRKKDYYISSTSNMCDCGSVIASNSKQLSTDQRYKSDIQRMKKKGWSDTKINRWIEQKQNGVHDKELLEDNNRWTSFIQEITNEKQVVRVGILIHWYSLGLEEEKIEIKEIQNIKVDAITEDTLEKLDYDKMYYFIK